MRLPARSTKHRISLYLCTDFPSIPGRIIFLRSFSGSRPAMIKRDNSPKVSRVPEQEIETMMKRVNKILQNTVAPSEEIALRELQHCEAYAKSITDLVDSQDSSQNRPSSHEKSPASTLLSLDEKSGNLKSLGLGKSPVNSPNRHKVIRQVSDLAYQIVTDPRIYITPKMLATYVSTQSLLGIPETIPQVFVLYAAKPIPIPSASPSKFKSPNPNKVSSAIPLVVATRALNAAIEAKDLPLCFDIINTSVCTTAFRRSKILRRALLPISGIALAPVAAYSLASQLSKYQDTMDPSTATNLAFVGILAYMGFTTTIGFVVVTTANDQMDRITWVTGTPLRERWLREDERALVDKVAGAWGFKEILKRGEEEGKDWETLREWVGMRGMVLDRVSLMEGME